MIHGIYFKNRPKGNWQLVSIAMSPEAVSFDIDELSKKAKKDGKEYFEVGFQVFESDLHIPEFLKVLKEQKLMYN
jgi:hypothetical protein